MDTALSYAYFDHLTDAVVVLASDKQLAYLNQAASDIPREDLSAILEAAEGKDVCEVALQTRSWTLYSYPQDDNIILICKAELSLDQRVQRVKAEFSRQVQNGVEAPEAAARLLHRELGWKWIAVAHYLDDERFEIDAFLEDGNLHGPIILDIADTPCEVVREAENFVYLNNVGRRFQGAGELGAQNYAGLVYRAPCGKEIGHIYMLHDNEDVDISATSSLMSAICTELGIFLELENAKQELVTSREMSLTDPLTGIGNRRSFDADLPLRLEEAERENGDSIVVFIDLDGFKKLNDKHGHEVGDQALIKIAEKANDLCSSDCKIYRYGGDEFVILSSRPGRWKGENLHDKRYMLQDHLASQGFDCLGVSLGAATYREAKADKEQMLRLADERMYEDKRQRKQAEQVA